MEVSTVELVVEVLLVVELVVVGAVVEDYADSESAEQPVSPNVAIETTRNSLLIEIVCTAPSKS